MYRQKEYDCLIPPNPKIATFYMLLKIHKDARKMNELQLEPDMLIVMCDVELLYTSIRHSDGLEATRFFLRTSGIDKDFGEFILRLLQFVLTHNFFIFKESFYLQIQGTAMGAPCAPSYANLFLGFLKRKIFLTDPVHQCEKVQLWYRNIDNVIMVWQGTTEELDAFMINLNRNDLNIKITHKAGTSNMDFLDMFSG